MMRDLNVVVDCSLRWWATGWRNIMSKVRGRGIFGWVDVVHVVRIVAWPWGRRQDVPAEITEWGWWRFDSKRMLIIIGRKISLRLLRTRMDWDFQCHCFGSPRLVPGHGMVASEQVELCSLPEQWDLRWCSSGRGFRVTGRPRKSELDRRTVEGRY